MSREATNKLLEMLGDGILDKDNVILACVNYMSEDDVRDMCHVNAYFEHEEEEEKGEPCDECGEALVGDDQGPSDKHDPACSLYHEEG